MPRVRRGLPVRERELLVEAGIDFSHKRNLIIASVILVIGIGGAKVHLGGLEISEMSLATYVGVILNLLLPREMEGAPAADSVSHAPDV